MALGLGLFPYFCKLFSSDANILNLKTGDGLFFSCLLVCVLNIVVISSAIAVCLEKPECLSLLALSLFCQY